MDKGLDFSIPETEKRKEKSSNKTMLILMIIILIAVLGNMIIMLYRHPGAESPVITKDAGAEELKQLALRLEKQGLADSSVNAWKEYMSTASMNPEEKARIWYRIGKLFQEDSRFEPALNAYYRSEIHGKPDDISLETGRRIQECLEALGKFAALNYELRDRTSARVNENEEIDSDPVVAEIGEISIRKSDLDARLEKLIGAQLSRLAPYMPEEQLKSEKERLLKQYSNDSQRRMFLEQYIAEELLYRNARESGLVNDAGVKDEIREMERSFLASKALEKAYTNEIKITLTDVQSYFNANKEKYVKDEKQQEFDEVKDRAALDLRQEKERDVQNRLLSELREKYNVVVHNSVLSDKSDVEK